MNQQLRTVTKNRECWRRRRSRMERWSRRSVAYLSKLRGAVRRTDAQDRNSRRPVRCWQPSSSKRRPTSLYIECGP